MRVIILHIICKSIENSFANCRFNRYFLFRSICVCWHAICWGLFCYLLYVNFEFDSIIEIAKIAYTHNFLAPSHFQTQLIRNNCFAYTMFFFSLCCVRLIRAAIIFI